MCDKLLALGARAREVSMAADTVQVIVAAMGQEGPAEEFDAGDRVLGGQQDRSTTAALHRRTAFHSHQPTRAANTHGSRERNRSSTTSTTRADTALLRVMALASSVM